MATMALKARSYREAREDLRELRLSQGLTPEQLGYLVGVSGRTIRRIEAGEARPTVRTMFLLASQFDLEVTDLWHL